MKELSNEELKELKVGEAITLASILAVMAIAIVTVICFRLFFAGKGSVKLPGGFDFDWGTGK